MTPTLNYPGLFVTLNDVESDAYWLVAQIMSFNSD